MTYLQRFFTEKGLDLTADLNVPGNMGLTLQMLVDYTATAPKKVQNQIRNMYVRIDFKNGLYEHFTRHLIRGMVLATSDVELFGNDPGQTWVDAATRGSLPTAHV